ncbi:MAG: proton-conducting transporter membrane subunit [Coprococcus sp.]
MIKGTWVQYTWIILSVLTIFMGSMMAYKEKILKKRLAYSTVSQVSYILFGLSVMQPVAFVGALMHVIFHSLVKNTLFVSAGAIICKTGKTKVRQLVGIGKEMPVTMWCFTLVSLTLIGIPPTSALSANGI